MTEYRWLRRWGRVGALVYTLRRDHPWAWPVRWWYGLCDALIWAWWRAGGEYEGVGHLRAYRAVEARFGRAWVAFYARSWDWIDRNIGE